MIEWANRGEEVCLPYRRTPDNFCGARLPTLKWHPSKEGSMQGWAAFRSSVSTDHNLSLHLPGDGWFRWFPVFGFCALCFYKHSCPSLFYFNLFYWHTVENVVLISAIQHRGSVIPTQILLHILFHYGLWQDIEYSALCYTVGPGCLSILYIIVCIC